MSRFRNDKGFTLVEIAVSMAILGILVFTLIRIQRTVMRGTETVLDQSALTRTLMLIKSDIVKEDRFLPAQEMPADVDPLDVRTMDRYLDNPEMSMIRCYNRYGTEVRANANEDCRRNILSYFVVTYVKFRQPDVNFFQNPANPNANVQNAFNRLPLGHYRVRINYTPNPNTPKSLTFSHYLTSLIIY